MNGNEKDFDYYEEPKAKEIRCRMSEDGEFPLIFTLLIIFVGCLTFIVINC